MTASESGTILLKTIDGSKQYKDNTSFIKHVINKVGSQNVMQTIANYICIFKAVGLLIETKYQQIF